MPTFSEASSQKLRTCDPKLQLLFNKVILYRDCTILEGHRGEAKQNEYFKKGTSQLPWPKGNHNTLPSFAVDVAPYPLNWKDIERFRDFAHFVKGMAAAIGIEVINGGLDWETFKDWPHWELRR